MNFYKKSKIKVISAALALIFITSLSASALTKEVVPLGRTTGIKLFSEGAMVVGFSSVGAKSGSPAQNAGIKMGDILTRVNGYDVGSNEDVARAVAESETSDIAVEILRGTEKMSLSVKAEKSEEDGKLRMGAWVRDSMAGIGTITFVDPTTGKYGALGHGVNDSDTGTLMPIDRGSLMKSNVVGINQGKVGEPGELKGSFDLSRDQGTLTDNEKSGVYGVLEDTTIYGGMQTMPTAKKSEIEKGKAYIYSNISEDQIEKFEIEITKIYNEYDTELRDMMIEITDERLISATGGIVQGMSGSPIIQNGKIIGAVTHVLVNNPKCGYAIAIERMLEDAEVA